MRNAKLKSKKRFIKIQELSLNDMLNYVKLDDKAHGHLYHSRYTDMNKISAQTDCTMNSHSIKRTYPETLFTYHIKGIEISAKLKEDEKSHVSSAAGFARLLAEIT